MYINIGKLRLFMKINRYSLELGYYIDDGTYYNMFPENWAFYKQFDVYKLLKNEIIFRLLYRFLRSVSFEGCYTIGGCHYSIWETDRVKLICISDKNWDTIGEFVHNGERVVDTTGWFEISV